MSSQPSINTPRLFVDEPLNAGAEIAAAEGQAHYLRQVMRREAGAPMRLFNGRDGEWIATLNFQGKKNASFTVTTQTRTQAAEPALTLAFAPLKSHRLEMIIEKATELGAVTLQPVITARSIAQKVNEARLQAIAVEAAEQCERLTVPLIAAPLKWSAFISALQADVNTTTYFLDEDAARRGVAAGPATVWRAAATPALILVGPEGGFTADEAFAVRALPRAVPLSLGPRILRAETAAIAALACWQALSGDWRGPQTGG